LDGPPVRLESQNAPNALWKNYAPGRIKPRNHNEFLILRFRSHQNRTLLHQNKRKIKFIVIIGYY